MDRVVVQPIDKDKFRVYKDLSYRDINIPKGFDISFKIIGNSCKIDMASGDMSLSSAMKWRQ